MPWPYWKNSQHMAACKFFFITNMSRGSTLGGNATDQCSELSFCYALVQGEMYWHSQSKFHTPEWKPLDSRDFQKIP